MVNQVVYDYLKRYSDSYTFEDLRRKILDAGYTQVDVDEAIKKIQTGRGNLIDRVESLKTLGAKASKQISQKFIQEAKDGEGDQNTGSKPE